MSFAYLCVGYALVAQSLHCDPDLKVAILTFQRHLSHNKNCKRGRYLNIFLIDFRKKLNMPYCEENETENTQSTQILYSSVMVSRLSCFRK